MKAKDGLPVPVRLTEGLGRSRGFEARGLVSAFIGLEDTGRNVRGLRRFFADREPDFFTGAKCMCSWWRGSVALEDAKSRSAAPVLGNCEALPRAL